MAKRRFRKVRTSPTRSLFRAKKRSSRKSSSSGYGLKSVAMKVLSAGAYGFGREKVSEMIAPVTSQLPLGGYADEVGMIGVSYLAGKTIPALRPIADAGLYIEGARIGQKLAGTMTAKSSSNGSFTTIHG